MQLQVGMRVQAVGLKSQAHLNGQEGHLVAWVEGEQRWKVRMKDGAGKMLKVSNLLLPVQEAPAATLPDKNVAPLPSM
eukprot:1603642-Amphidinium_carterae.1